MLHLACFILLVIAANYVPKKTLSTNAYVVKLLLGFITVPLYIFMILWLESALEDDRLKMVEGPPDYKIKGRICVSKDMGNVKMWAHIEIITFYLNIVVMMIFLLKTHFIKRGLVAAPPKAALKTSDPMLTRINETLVNEVVEEDEKIYKQNEIITKALREIDNSSDLLRTIDSSRSFNRLHMLMFLMCLSVLYFQPKQELTLE
jgi:hypothetical protein